MVPDLLKTNCVRKEDNMKILHVFTDQNYVYVEALIKLFYSNFPEYKNDFLICSKKKNVPKSIVDFDCEKRITYLNCSKRFEVFTISKVSKKYNYIIYHFLPNDPLIHLYYYFHSKAINKIIWRIWGADLYNWKKKSPKYIIDIINVFRSNTRKKIRYVILEPMDIAEYKRQFNSDAILLNGPDPKGYDSIFLDSHRKERNNDSYTIIVGHSAVRFVNHIEILNSLSKFKDYNIRIVLPLNYGDPKYAELVEKTAIDLFGTQKIKIIRDKMSLEEYVEFMWNCDALIIHSDRQIAMGNITMMLYMGKKVFVKGNSIMDDYYIKSNELEMYDSSTISSIQFNDFISPVKNTEKNKAFAINEIELPNIINMWKTTFNQIDNIKEA